ncbi:MAG: protoporphyrinogen oxidase [Simkaniaceae bacterium]
MKKIRKAAILGGGISGLSLAYYLKKYIPDLDIDLYEKKQNFGGVISSIDEEFFFEQGPHTFRASKSKDLLCLIAELELNEQLIIADRASSHRYIYFRQKLHPLPRSIGKLLVSPLTRKIVPRLLMEWAVPPSRSKDESIYHFFRRRLGKTAAEILGDALTAGIFAGDIHKLSISHCFPSLHHMEQQFGSLTKALLLEKKKHSFPIPHLRGSDLFTLRKGLRYLVEALVQKTPCSFYAGTAVDQIEKSEDQVILHSSKGRNPYDFVFCALPSTAAASLLHISLDISAVDIIAVNLGFKKKLSHPRGFGYLVPAAEQEKILGTVFDSDIFPMQNKEAQESRFTVMLGGSRGSAAQESDEECIQRAVQSLQKHLHISQVPDRIAVKRHAEAIPQYHLFHEEKIQEFEEQIKQKWPHVRCVGNYLAGVSLNDCIKLSKHAAKEFLKQQCLRP